MLANPSHHKTTHKADIILLTYRIPCQSHVCKNYLFSHEEIRVIEQKE